MQLLYPNSLFEPQKPDENYEAEFEAAKDGGIEVSLFSYEQFLAGSLKITPDLHGRVPTLYRGWMLEPSQYADLHSQLTDRGVALITAPDQYELCHYLPRWYSLLKEFTPETMVFNSKSDVVAGLQAKRWDSCFLKDYVKSLSTHGGSIARSLNEIPGILDKMEKYRGKIEGGICARKIEEFIPATENRFFVIKGIAVSSTGVVPELIDDVARAISSPFFSVDVAQRNDGALRIIEIGDGQVSDLKQWKVAGFISALKSKFL